MVLLGYIIKHNPCIIYLYKVYTTFPAALPIMFVAEFWCKIIKLKKY